MAPVCSLGLALFVIMTPAYALEATTTTQAATFGQVQYSERVSQYPPALPEDDGRSIELKVAAGRFSFVDDGESLTFRINISNCTTLIPVDGYEYLETRDALERRFESASPFLRLYDCALSPQGLDVVHDEYKAALGDLAAAIAHMKTRALGVRGHLKRCDARDPRALVSDVWRRPACNGGQLPLPYRVPAAKSRLDF